MARASNKPTAPAEAPEILPAVAERIEAAQNAALSTTETEELLALGKTVGQMEMAAFFGNISDTAALAAFENVKKSKAWRHLRGADGEIFPNLEQFCKERLGFSERRLRQVIANRTLVGQEAFEQAERLGLRQVDYNAIKALPAPDQELVRRAVEDSKSRDEVIDLLQELAVRHAQARSERDEAVAEKEATEQLLADKNKRIDQLKAAQKRINAEPPDERMAAIQAEAASIAADVQGRLQGTLRQAILAVINSGEERGQHDVFLAGLVGQVQARLTELRDEFSLPEISEAAQSFEPEAANAIRAGLAEMRAQKAAR